MPATASAGLMWPAVPPQVKRKFIAMPPRIKNGNRAVRAEGRRGLPDIHFKVRN
jgi:hypothetical protein